MGRAFVRFWQRITHAPVRGRNDQWDEATRRRNESSWYQSRPAPWALGCAGERRFIPARAGNTSGSARGLPAKHRFIPARAGNTKTNHVGQRTVHPRPRGEHLVIGSSPPARGTRCSCEWTPFIDGSSPPARGTRTVGRGVTMLWYAGSSPPARGTRQSGARFLNGSSPPARGTLGAPRTPRTGSSPPARGTPQPSHGGLATVHPRPRGEHQAVCTRLSALDRFGTLTINIAE